MSTSLDDCIHRSLPHIFDAAKPKANTGFAAGVILNGEVITAVVDVWRKNLNAHIVTFRNIDGAFFVVVLPGGK